MLAMTSQSCKKKEDKSKEPPVIGNYFSIRQFALDEWNTFAGDAFVIQKTVRVNGKTDTSYTNSDTINWNPIFKTFFETDISDRKYIGQYKFTQFDDNADGTHNFFYQTDDEDLFTQKLLITIQGQSGLITGIYMETLRHSLFSDVIQKLYYNPMKTIQIITDEKPRFGSKKLTVVQYDFMR